MKLRTRRIAAAAAVGIAGAAAIGLGTASADPQNGPSTTTPIKHLVVIFQENVSFDHYFATYPQATNPSGEPRFTAAAGTPSVNGLGDSLTNGNNPNSTQPFRFDRSQFQTCSQDHNYTHEQQAFDSGLMDKFPESTDNGDTTVDACGTKPGGQVMGYYDGNTVTALWNYAQNFAMNDNSFSTTFGPSTVGAINLISGQTHGFTPEGTAVTANQTIIGDPQPAGDKCDFRDQSTQLPTSNDKNVGDLLNAKNITWGWFQGGFDNCAPSSNPALSASHTSKGGVTSVDYIPHHEPFQYYRSTQNLQHLPPSSTDMIGKTDQANHQYDLTKWNDALQHGNMPAVSFLKAPAYQDGHAGYSNPLDEQDFLVSTINTLQKSQYWKDTAVVIAYDDSDGWYDHQMSPIVNQSQDPGIDALRGGVDCGSATKAMGGYQDRCGYGPRQPLLVISPFAKTNFVDHTITDQTSILRFVEDNWGTGRIGDASFDAKANPLTAMFDFSSHPNNGNDTLLLDPSTGQPQHGNQHN
jgi:phospholipase C